MVVNVIIGIVIIIGIYSFVTYNKLVKYKNLVKEAFSTMDVYLKKRWELVPNLVEIVKGYAKYEREFIENITSMKMNTYESMSIDQKVNWNEQLTKEVLKMIAISENFPELKANESFVKLSRELIQIEDEIENSRKYYNGTVRIFNTNIQMFPSNLIAKLFGFHLVSMFEANIEEK